MKIVRVFFIFNYLGVTTPDSYREVGLFVPSPRSQKVAVGYPLQSLTQTRTLFILYIQKVTPRKTENCRVAQRNQNKTTSIWNFNLKTRIL